MVQRAQKLMSYPTPGVHISGKNSTLHIVAEFKVALLEIAVRSRKTFGAESYECKHETESFQIDQSASPSVDRDELIRGAALSLMILEG